MISAQEKPKKTVNVNGRDMAYVEIGEGEPILFLHGNPTSSYLWRNVMPHLEGQGRLIAPDLIGMGDSEKLRHSGPNSYRFAEHAEYLDGFIEAVLPDGKVTLVVHDWGSGLGFYWARRHPDRVRGVAYMEAIVMPVAWSDWPDNAKAIFEAMRSDAGEELVLEKNIFVERILPNAILRDLTAEEMEVYRKPYREAGEDRRPTLTWPRQIPIDGHPADVDEIVRDYGRWLETSDIPKLFINAEPGSILIDRQREFCRGWANQKEVTVKGLHFVQEDSPDEIGEAIAEWRRELLGGDAA